MNGLIIPRRKFLIGSGQLITSLFVAPAIVKATSLDMVDSLDNRMMVGFKPAELVNDPTYGYTYGYSASYLNTVKFLNSRLIDAWKREHPTLRYSLVRKAEIKRYAYRLSPTCSEAKYHYNTILSRMEFKKLITADELARFTA